MRQPPARHLATALTAAVFMSACGSQATTTDAPSDEQTPAPQDASASPSPTGTPAPSTPSSVSSSPVPSTSPSSESTGEATTPPPQEVVIEDPERLRIPAIEVDAPIVDLGRTEQGSLQVPQEWDATGWWTGGITPGRIGPAVIAGHIDSKAGPAVFFRLEELKEGDEIHVVGAEGQTLTFQVDGMEQFPKAEFPTNRIYGPTPDSQLRLITCGGPFDSSWGHYLDNVVVYASET